ncbi:white-opaque regulator 1 [Diplogelasinospora grovesii]|uniref:White-opaque regulator 1 n=1 Tax=Diplogelasinospora grovesii TaxID=303347 RepID=A0AAN6S4N5_9PEZI|nr:white-opaque regulator 1 [Diplogelasinospora grovesii]
MVFCGKASQGCQNCRTRRIKCDKVRPQCTQCIRVGKACPGYRDRLSLMFRDESTKVIQKAHAQWGMPEPPSSEAGEPSHCWPTSASAPVFANYHSDSTARRPRFKPETPTDDYGLILANVPKAIYATKVDQAIHFYLEHYVIGYPDEPRASEELHDKRWVHNRELQDIMAAIGLAGLSNLTGDKELYTMARQKYGLALQHTASSLQNLQGLDLEFAVRSVVMLAMFEVIRSNTEPSNTTRAHIMGGAALLRSFIPLHRAPSRGLRALLQLCFSMFIPCVVVGIPLPEIFFEWITLSEKLVMDQDKPSLELICTITRFVQLSAYVRGHALSDGRPTTTRIIRELVDLDAQLERWEEQCQIQGQGGQGIWVFAEERCGGGGPSSEGVFFFENCHHMYTDLWTARVWNHYRWARISVDQMLCECVERFPSSSSLTLLISATQQQLYLRSISRMARDTLISIPTHWRHPKMDKPHRDCLDRTRGGVGMGAAGVPTLLFQIKVVACAPGVPYSYWSWAVGVLDTIWADTGILQAKALADLLRVHQDKLQQQHILPEAIILKKEESDD